MRSRTGGIAVSHGRCRPLTPASSRSHVVGSPSCAADSPVRLLGPAEATSTAMVVTRGPGAAGYAVVDPTTPITTDVGP